MMRQPETVVLDPLEIEADPEEVLRYLGYPVGATPDKRAREGVRSAIQAARERQRPRGLYAVHPVVSQTRSSLSLSDGTIFRGSIGSFLGGATHAAAFLATAGAEVENLGNEAAQNRDPMLGLAFHALGAHLAEAAVERLMTDLRSRLQAGDALTMRYSPGYCGIPMRQQARLFRLFDASRIGVELLPSMLMRPLKSVSGLVGIGRSESVRAYGNPCDMCPLTDCNMRR